MSALVDLDASIAETLRSALGPDGHVLPSLEALRRHLDTQPAEDAVVLGPGDGIEVGLIGREGMSGLVDQHPQAAHGAGHRHHMGTFAGQRQAERLAEPARGAGDDGDLAGKPAAHPTSASSDSWRGSCGSPRSVSAVG